jgi:hypothetical protein
MTNLTKIRRRFAPLQNQETVEPCPSEGFRSLAMLVRQARLERWPTKQCGFGLN